MVNASIGAEAKESIVYLHGSNFTAKSWSLLVGELDEYSNHMMNLPGREDALDPKEIDLDYSAKILCLKLNKIKEPFTIVAHSQAGAILNHSLSFCPNLEISKIIYLAAVVPLNNEKVFSKLSKEDEKHYFSGIIFDEKSSSLVVENKEKFVSSFAGKVSEKEKKLILSAAVSEPALIGEGTVLLDLEKFKTIKKYYIHTSRDKIISMSSQQEIVSKIKFENKFTLDSNHLPMVTHFQELSQIIKTILN